MLKLLPGAHSLCVDPPFQSSYGFLLVPLSLTKEPAQLGAALPDQPHEQLCSEDLGGCE